MDQEQRIARLEEQIDELLELSEENNKILISMQRAARWSFWGRLLIWIIVLILPFIVLGPFLRALVPGFSNNGSRNLFGLPSSAQVQQLLDSYKQGSGSSSSE